MSIVYSKQAQVNRYRAKTNWTRKEVKEEKYK
jgi:hypothetical protein